MGGRGGNSGLSPKGGSVKFPELQGSEKQVEWANRIRQEAMDTIEHQIQWHKETIPQRPYDKDYLEASLESYKEIKKAISDTFSSVNEASKIIEIRFLPPAYRILREKRQNKKLGKRKDKDFESCGDFSATFLILILTKCSMGTKIKYK